MVRAILLAILLAGFFPIITPGAPTGADSSGGKVIYVLPIRDEIEESMVFQVRRGVKEAMKLKAAALVLHMNTPGGEGEAMRKIMEAIGKFEPATETYTVVDKQAFSAGAFIAASTRHIYMTPGSNIGAATPIALGQGGLQELPQKFVSAYAGIIRAVAEQNGHNPLVFDAMVNKDKGLTVDGKEISPKGSVLTLTTAEATQLLGTPPKPLLAQPIHSLDELFSKLGAGRTIQFKATGYERIARVITMISPFLLTAALILGYLEFKIPGTTLFGVGSAICFLLVFFGHYIAGLSGHEPLLLFILGAALVAVEIVLLPGTLLPAFAGLVFILGALLYSMADLYPTDSWLPSAAQLELPAYNLGIALLLALAGCLIIYMSVPQKVFIGNLDAVTVPGPATDAYTQLKPGQRGVATSPLRPAGTAQFGERWIDVVSDGGFIERNSTVEIIRVEGMRAVVKSISEKQTT
jgi:membrane-bound serine protease (ClpP class)